MNILELKVPPPVVALCLALLMWLTSSFVKPFEIPLLFRIGAALGLVAIGQSISIAGILSFRRAKTTVSPLKPSATSSLVSSGVYRFTRNPMYIGLLLTLLAWAVFLSNPASLIFLPLYVLYINRFQIEPEERALSSLFGAAYVDYKKTVRKWL